jgi:hypothetical protein
MKISQFQNFQENISFLNLNIFNYGLKLYHTLVNSKNFYEEISFD